MKLSDLAFPLPKELIAKYPLPHRRDSRLLVLREHDTVPVHRHFPHIIEYLLPGDVLVLNNTHVLPARLLGHRKDTGGKVDLLLSRVEPDGTWIALMQTKSLVPPGAGLVLGALEATVVESLSEEPGAYRVVFHGEVVPYAEKHGHIPLPPYMEREWEAEDAIRYQTVFSDPGQNQAVAAPTAGLHFDEALLAEIEAKGVKLVYVTLHVGPGTFLPIRTDNLDEHQMHAEPWTVSVDAARTLNEAKSQGRRVIAVGTTTVRTLESAVDATGCVQAGSGLTRLFIQPGDAFRVVDGLITNFHLPQTTLLLLVAAAIGPKKLLEVYQEAIAEKYRFFSYGDACFFDVRDRGCFFSGGRSPIQTTPLRKERI